jgi:hypothetical protein
MATVQGERNSLLVGEQGPRGGHSAMAYRVHAARALMAVAAIFGLGSVLDLGVLWGLQRQPGPEWEFGALATTVEGLPRIALAVGFAYGALMLNGTAGALWYRLLALVLLAVGVAGAVIGAMMLSDYFVLREIVNPEAVGLFRSSVFKTLALSGLYVLLLLPVGVLGLRTPKR